MAKVGVHCPFCGTVSIIGGSDYSEEDDFCSGCGESFFRGELIGSPEEFVFPSKLSIDKALETARKLRKNGHLYEARMLVLDGLKKRHPQDYRPWFEDVKILHEDCGRWLDDDLEDYLVAKAIAKGDDLAAIVKYRDEAYEKAAKRSRGVVEFCENPDISKLYYSYLKVYLNSDCLESQGLWYWGIEPVDGIPAFVKYSSNPNHGYLREVLFEDISVAPVFKRGRFYGVISGAYIDKTPRDTLYLGYKWFISEIDGDRVVFNENPQDMLYGDVLRPQSVAIHEVERSGCYVATCVYGSYDCPQVWTLRRFRDETLASSGIGRAFVHFYYFVSPTLVRVFGDRRWFKKAGRRSLDLFVGKLQTLGVESSPYEDKTW